MNEKEILNSIKSSIDEAPISILENIKDAPKTKMLKHDDITKQKTSENFFKKFIPYASIAAAFILVFFGWQYQTNMPYSHIYIDVNPSIEIITNRVNKVIEIEGGNIDGRLLTEDLQYKGKTINQVTEEFLDRLINENYLNKDHKYLLLSVYNKNQDIADIQKLDLDKNIHQHLEKKGLVPVVLSQNLEKTSTIETFAKRYKVSVSKMTFIRNLIILNPKLQIEELIDLSLEELVDLSQDMELDLNKIIYSRDFDKIKTSKRIPTSPIDDEDKDDYVNQDIEIISIDQAKKIALSIANGIITDFDFDYEDLEYEVEIELDGLEYEITIDAIRGKVIEVEVDD